MQYIYDIAYRILGITGKEKVIQEGKELAHEARGVRPFASRAGWRRSEDAPNRRPYRKPVDTTPRSTCAVADMQGVLGATDDLNSGKKERRI